MKAPITDKHLFEMMWERFPEVMRRGSEQGAIPHSGADESPPVFGRRWKLAQDGFGLQRDDANGNYVHIDDALSVLHQSLNAALGITGGAK